MGIILTTIVLLLNWIQLGSKRALALEYNAPE